MITPLTRMDGFFYRAVMGEVFGVRLPVAELEGLVPDKAKGGTTEKLKLGAGRREVKSKTHSKARNSPANSGDAFAPARAFSRRALPAGWCGLSSRLLTASAKSATFTPRPLP